ncbi:MAG: MEDS domain-containing protein [Betaproteobacteria bacterium]
MKDVALAQLTAEIEELRKELNRAVQKNHQNLQAPAVQALSTRLDVLIAEFVGHRKSSAGESLRSFPRRPASMLSIQAYGNPIVGVCQGPARSVRYRLQDEFRRSGADAMRLLPWGMHLCQFYASSQDLADVLVPYFRAGLEHNEFCLWVTCEPFGRAMAREALAQAVPGLEGYLRKGQLEILSSSEWYIRGGAFNADSVIEGWAAKLDQALSRGFDGMRLSGDTSWIEPKDWTKLVEYENRVDIVIRSSRMKAICAYPVDKCGPRETADVLREHRLAFIKDADGWQLV